MTTTEEVIITRSDIVFCKRIIKTLGKIEARCGRLVFRKRKSAQENLVKKAIEVGANAIVGYSHTKGWARGIAVFVE